MSFVVIRPHCHTVSVVYTSINAANFGEIIIELVLHYWKKKKK